MKNTYTTLAFAFLLCCSQQLFGQGASCATAEPFCTDNGAAFPASTSTISEGGPDYGCLLDQPNPAWYYLQIDQSGNIDIALSNSNNEDIDFICWGPFNTLASACSNLTGGGGFDMCTIFGTYPCGNIVDCSFDIASTEEINIPSAVSGQFYMVLITNYSGVATDIYAQTLGSSTGNTDCSIVTPPTNCLMDFFSANISACDPGNTFGISGDFTYVDNPGTGTVVVVVDNGTTTYTQTFNPPFVDGQTYSYNITGIPADGAASTISVYFTADPACTQTIAYNAVADCSCAASIGTFSETVTGQSNIDYVLCFGDDLNVNTNNDYTDPEEQFNPPGPTYDPGIGWLVYSCPPTIGLTPSANEDVINDPCLLGVWGYGDLAETNDQYWINAYPGVFTDNIVYFVPITMYSIVEGYYSYTNTAIGCYDLGIPYAVQYLPEMTSTQTEDCTTGEVTATFNGGYPAIDGSQYTVVPGSMTPATAVFVNTTCTSGGDIVLGNLVVGDNYSFDVADANGCALTISGVMDGSGNATLTYPQTDYCITDPNTSPNLVGTAGGTYSSTAGLSINAVTGVITIGTSTAGTYNVTYVGPGAACPPSSTFTLTIHALPLVNAGPDQSVCEGTQVTLSGSGDPANYVWNNGVANGVAFVPAATQTYTVTATTAAGCVNTDQVTVTVETAPIPAFSANVTSGCSPLQVTFTNLSGGVNCVWDFGNGATAVGCNQVVANFVNVGCYDITLTSSSAAGCTGTTVLQNYICVSPDPIASFTPIPSIMSELDPTTQMYNNSQNASSYQWNFGDGEISVATSPAHTYPENSPGSYVIQLIATSPFGCTDTAYATVVVEEELIFYVPNTFTPDGDEFNQSFQPVFNSGFDPFDFNMLIFNRWGEIIFESNNAEIGWDGTYNGKRVQEGTYTWKIEFKTSKNDAHKMVVGHVSVLK